MCIWKQQGRKIETWGFAALKILLCCQAVFRSANKMLVATANPVYWHTHMLKCMLQGIWGCFLDHHFKGCLKSRWPCITDSKLCKINKLLDSYYFFFFCLFFPSLSNRKDISLENAGRKPTDNSEGKITYELLKGLFTEVELISISLRNPCTCCYHTNSILVGGLKIS